MRSAAAPNQAVGHLVYVGRETPCVDLLDVLARHRDVRPSFYWESPEHEEAVLALGAIERVTSSGTGRFAEAAAAIEQTAARMMPGADHDDACPEPIFVGGFAFSPEHVPIGAWREFGPCLFLVPAELWLRAGGRTWRLQVRVESVAPPDGAPAQGLPDACATDAAELRIAAESAGEGGSDEAAEQREWSSRVERVLQRIHRGDLEKVVLARKAHRRLRTQFDALATLRALRSKRPHCVTFRFAPGQTELYGSTPELLVRLDGLSVETHALAGTAARGENRQLDEDLARALYESPKNRHEQDLVTRDLIRSLASVAIEIDVPESPRILSVPEAHHLMTPLRARLGESTSVLALAERLHPTPATCGTPRSQARSLIDAEERDRGWYTGAVGWVAANGDGAFAVALRSAVVDREHLTAWAGAGIVDGSRAADEYAEVDLKLRAILGALAS